MHQSLYVCGVFAENEVCRNVSCFKCTSFMYPNPCWNYSFKEQNMRIEQAKNELQPHHFKYKTTLL